MFFVFPREIVSPPKLLEKSDVPLGDVGSGLTYCWWHQLRLVTYQFFPSIYTVLYIPGGDRQISEPWTRIMWRLTVGAQDPPLITTMLACELPRFHRWFCFTEMSWYFTQERIVYTMISYFCNVIVRCLLVAVGFSTSSFICFCWINLDDKLENWRV